MKLNLLHHYQHKSFLMMKRNNHWHRRRLHRRRLHQIPKGLGLLNHHQHYLDLPDLVKCLYLHRLDLRRRLLNHLHYLRNTDWYRLREKHRHHRQ